MAFKKGWFKGVSQPSQGTEAPGGGGSKRGGSGGDKRPPQRVLGLASLRWGVPQGATELCPSMFFTDLWVRPVGDGGGPGKEGDQGGDLVVGRWSLFTPQGVDPCSGLMVPQRQYQYWVDSLKLPLPGKGGDGSRHLDLLRLSFSYYALLSRVLLSDDGEALLEQFLGQLPEEDVVPYQEYLSRVFDSGYLHLLVGEGKPLLGQGGGLNTSLFAYTPLFASEESVRNGVPHGDVANVFSETIGVGVPVAVALSGVHWPKTTLLLRVTQWVNRHLMSVFRLGVDNVAPDQVLSELPQSLHELIAWARQCENAPYYLVSLAVSCAQVATVALDQVDRGVRGKMVMVQENVGASGAVDRRLYFIVNGKPGDGGAPNKWRGGKRQRSGPGGSVWGKRVSGPPQAQNKVVDTSDNVNQAKGVFKVWKKVVPAQGKREEAQPF